MHHPSRGGVRGGQDQFDWEDVKLDKHRENYLGHSLMAPVGRWQKGKDLQWFSKSAEEKKRQNQEEISAIKRMEAEAMASVLGGGPVKKGSASNLTKQELAEALRRGQSERDSMNIERVEGMGFGSQRSAMMSPDSGFVAERSSTKRSEGVTDQRDSQANKEESRSKDRSRKHKKHEKKLKRKKKSRIRHDSSSDSDSDRATRNDRRRQREEERNDDRHKSKYSDSDNERSKETHRNESRSSDKTTHHKRRHEHDSKRSGSEDERRQRKKRRKSKHKNPEKSSKSRKRHDSSSDQS